MSYLINNQQKVNDIIFANRNKTYGAYAIRSAYGSTIFKSLVLTFFGFGSIMSAAFYLSNRPTQQSSDPAIITDDSTYTITVTLPPDMPKPSTPPQLPSGSSSSGLGTVISSTASADSGTTTEVSTVTSTGTLSGAGPSGPPAFTVAATPTVDLSGDPVPIPDTAPEFDGGLRALYAFLASKLKYPEDAYENGKGGTVYVKFVVDQNGKVCNLKLLNNLGFGMDEEALRVVAMIPDFKIPGKVGGKAVKVYYQLPIKFNVR